MKYKSIGTTDMQASVIILGAWAIGGFQWGGSDETESIRTIHAAMDEGINTIDTAPIYGFGESENRIGKALKGRRDKILIATKCGLVWHVEEGRFFFSTKDSGAAQHHPNKTVYCYHHPKSIRFEIEKSLRRLKTDYIDIYQIHHMDHITPISEVMDALLRLREEGKIRAIGISNATVDDLRQYREAGILDTNQERYSLFDRKVEDTNIRFCSVNEMAFLAYSPLFHGLLTGKVSPHIKFKDDDFRKTRMRFTPHYIEKVNLMLGDLIQLAQEKHATISQLILAYMLHQFGCTHLIVGARKKTHVIENARAADLDLSAEELEMMDNHFSRYSPKLEL